MIKLYEDDMSVLLRDKEKTKYFDIYDQQHKENYGLRVINKLDGSTWNALTDMNPIDYLNQIKTSQNFVTKGQMTIFNFI